MYNLALHKLIIYKLIYFLLFRAVAYINLDTLYTVFLYNICCLKEKHNADFPLPLSTIIQNFNQISQSTTELQ